MLATTTILVTRHCLNRYQHRIGPATATEAEIIRIITESKPAGRGSMPQIRKAYKAVTGKKLQNRDDVFYLLSNQAIRRGGIQKPRVVFVIKVAGIGQWVAVTCWKYTPCRKTCS